MENEVAKTDREQAAFWKEQFTQLKAENEALRVDMQGLRQHVEEVLRDIGAILDRWRVSPAGYSTVTGGTHGQGGDSSRGDRHPD